MLSTCCACYYHLLLFLWSVFGRSQPLDQPASRSCPNHSTPLARVHTPLTFAHAACGDTLTAWLCMPRGVLVPACSE